ncbi:MAG: glycosyltransferase [Sandaracinaceae bacterium]|nr:glycosyltransferase [Sandaracinaceae bacterium]
MTRLHVAAMPFPTVQGTQAALRMMLDAEHAAGRAPALLSYAHGGFEHAPPWPHHRTRDLVRDRSLESGPSWRKVAQDAQLALAVRRLQPARTIAHHVEAAAAALAARAHEVVFFAHTALGEELPEYLTPRAARLAGRAGEALDVALARRAWRVGAVSPWLAAHLARAAARPVRYVPIPWAVPAPLEAAERSKARARFGLEPSAPVLVYAGNLDAYQGLEVMAAAFARLLVRRPDAWLLVATQASSEPLERLLWPTGAAARTRFAPLADEPDRRAAHAAADVAWIPRRAPGGLPVKLLDALARGVPTVAARRACAGIEVRDAAQVVADDDPEALAAAALLALEGRDAARALAARGRAYVAAHHAPETYLAAMDALEH